MVNRFRHCCLSQARRGPGSQGKVGMTVLSAAFGMLDILQVVNQGCYVVHWFASSSDLHRENMYRDDLRTLPIFTIAVVNCNPVVISANITS